MNFHPSYHKNISRQLSSWLPVFLFLLSSCEEVVNPEIDPGFSQLVIDAWITDQPGEQVIKLRRSSPYFDNRPAAGVTGATVTVTDDSGNLYTFTDPDQNGDYVWMPADPAVSLGQIGRSYSLLVSVDGETYTAVTHIKRVPEIDSIFYEYREEELGQPEGYYAELYARDLPGVGDSYWIKAWKNGVFLNKPQEINLSFDGAFSAGGNADGLTFIRPIREGINRVPDTADDAVDNDEVPPYALGDSIYVEIHAIPNEAFYYMLEVRTQTDRDGGIGEIFAPPIANVFTNIRSSSDDPKKQAIGFFAGSAVSKMGTRIVE